MRHSGSSAKQSWHWYHQPLRGGILVTIPIPEQDAAERVAGQNLKLFSILITEVIQADRKDILSKLEVIFHG